MKALSTRLGLIVGGSLLAVAGMTTPAIAGPAPVLSCGTVISTSCSQTATYTDTDQWLTPVSPAPASCPAYIGNDLGHLVGTGHGVEHVNLNKAGDFWATSTFTGDVSISFYNPSAVNATYDEQGNIVSAAPTGQPDDVVTGHMTQWFGVSDNNQSGVFTITFSLRGVDQNGTPVSLHGVTHANWTPGTEPFAGPPHTFVSRVSC
ncbi:MAG: hypothetical protein ABI808_13915 [Pseudonocardiales bacterium]